jgi:hypothetical protein
VSAGAARAYLRRDARRAPLHEFEPAENLRYEAIEGRGTVGKTVLVARGGAPRGPSRSGAASADRIEEEVARTPEHRTFVALVGHTPSKATTVPGCDATRRPPRRCP